MRILFLGDAHSPHLQTWVAFFARRGHEVHVCHLGRRGPGGLVPEATLHEPLRMRSWIRGGWRLSVSAVRALLRELEPDVVHSHAVVPSGYLAARAGARPHVATAWGSDVLRAPRRNRRLIAAVARQADLFTADSRHLLGALERYGAPADRLRLVPWGVDRRWLERGLQLARPDAARQLGLPDGRPMILAHRGVRDVYRPEAVIHAVPPLTEAIPDALVIVKYEQSCSGAPLRRLRRLAEQLGVAESIRFEPMSPHNEMPLLYRATSACVSVPESDSAPTSIPEALALGTPAVVSDLPWVREPEYCDARLRVVPVDDPAALAVALVEALREPSGADAEHNRRLVAARFDRTEIFAEMEQAYRTLAR